MDSLATTNIWLAILAIVSLLEFLIIVAAGVMAYRMYSQATEFLSRVERLHVAPLRLRADAILDEVQVMTTKLKHAQDSVSDTFKQVTGAGNIIADTVKARTWPILGVINGLRSAVQTLTSNGKRHDSPPGSRFGA